MTQKSLSWDRRGKSQQESWKMSTRKLLGLMNTFILWLCWWFHLYLYKLYKIVHFQYVLLLYVDYTSEKPKEGNSEEKALVGCLITLRSSELKPLPWTLLPLLTLDVGYLLRAAAPDLGSGVAPLGQICAVQPNCTHFTR